MRKGGGHDGSVILPAKQFDGRIDFRAVDDAHFYMDAVQKGAVIDIGICSIPLCEWNDTCLWVVGIHLFCHIISLFHSMMDEKSL